MTSSEAGPPPDGAPPAADPESVESPGPGAEPAEARTVASGHLHPGMLFLRFLDGLRQSAFMIAIALIAQQVVFAVLAGVGFLLTMGYALARYLTFKYRLTETELITTEGILHRQERRIPVNRIQDLSFESTIVRRFFGLVVVSVETASGQGAEAQLDSLSRVDAENLREALYRTRRFRGAGGEAEVVPENLLYRVGAAELFLLGLTNNRIGVIFAALFGLYELAGEFGLGGVVGGVFGDLMARLVGLHWTLLVVLFGAVLFLALLGGWLLSIAASFLMFHNFALTLREDVFQRRYGLITTRAASLPRRKIQRVLLDATFLRRLFGHVVLRADSAGSGMDPTEEARGGRDVVMPLAANALAESIVPVLLPGMDWLARAWTRVSPRVIWRIFLKGALFGVLLLIGGLGWLGLPGLLALFVLPIAYGIGVLSYHNLAYARHPDHLALRWGILGRYRAVVPLRKLQGVVIRQSPIDRIFGLASLTVYVAGGSPSTMPNLPVDEARALQTDVGRHVAASRFVW